MKPDLVIRGGTVVDGTGIAPFEADVIVHEGRILGLGRYDGRATDVIDARGKIVTPGFIDVHTHLDAQITWDPLGTPSNLHGVTSVVVGNCGVGFAPCKPGDRDYLMFLMEGVEDVPRAALKAGMRWDWETFPEYLDALGRQPLGLNVGAYLGHAPLRVYAMGEHGATDAAANDEQLAMMRGAVADAMRAGALGFSTGRTTMHRTPTWDPVPGTFADERELDALAGALAEGGTGVFELVPYGAAGEDAGGFRREYRWMLPLAKRHGLPISVVLIQKLKYPDEWRDSLALCERAAAEGASLRPQVAVRSVGVLIGFGTAISPLALYPGAGDLFGKPLDELRPLLSDPEVRRRLVESAGGSSGEILGGMATLDQVFPLEDVGVRAYENDPERSLTARAKRQGKHPLELMLDIIVERDLGAMFIVPLFNGDLDAAAEMIRHPLSTIGLGDSGAHTSQTADFAYTTFTLAYWVRQRRLLALEAAVRKLTLDLAALWGIPGRGRIAPGLHADLNIIDLDRLDLELPEVRYNLPAGAPHIHQGARGFDATIVNGTILMREGKHTGAHPGVVLRNAYASMR